MVAEVLGAGILGGLSPAMTAAVLSSLTYRKRGPGAPSTVRRGGDFSDRYARLVHLAGEVGNAEQGAGLAPLDPPDPGFAHRIHAWVGGAELAEVLDEDLPPGEFVRNVRLVADLLRQVAATADPEIAENALEAEGRLDRGVILLSDGRLGVNENLELEA